MVCLLVVWVGVGVSGFVGYVGLWMVMNRGKFVCCCRGVD